MNICKDLIKKMTQKKDHFSKMVIVVLNKHLIIKEV